MWRTLGQEGIISSLERSLKEGRLAHAYLLIGLPHTGKMTLAREMAQAVNCLQAETPCGQCVQCQRIVKGKHTDVQVIAPDTQPTTAGQGARKEIGIGQVREVQRLASLKPYEGKCRVFIFDGVERLSGEAANCLLKTLEEPPDQVLLLLLTSKSAEDLLPTIVSRCHTLELRPLPVATVAQELKARWEADPQKAQELALLSGGRLGWAIAALQDPDILQDRWDKLERIISCLKGGLEERFSYAADLAALFFRDRESTREEIELWLSYLKDLMVVKEGLEELVVNAALRTSMKEIAAATSLAQIANAAKAAEQAWEHLEQNANPRLALEVMMLDMPFTEGKGAASTRER